MRNKLQKTFDAMLGLCNYVNILSFDCLVIPAGACALERERSKE